jgi:exonuclease SbcC
MKIDKIILHGFTVFKDEVSLDLAALGPGLIAIAGPNGAGKSTILEAIPGCLYRESPTYGPVSNIATARDARIELIGENESPFTARLDVDAVSGKSEAVLLDGAGGPVAGPKVREYDKAIADHFPPLSVYLAAAFASQTGAGSLLKIDRAERRALFGRLLGLEHLENMAAAARDHSRQAETELAGIRAALAAVKEGSAEARELENALDEARERALRAAEFLTAARERVRDALSERDRLTAIRTEAQRAGKAVQEARQRADRLVQDANRIAASLAALTDILHEAPTIRQNAAEIATLSAELDGLRIRGEVAAAEERKATDEASQLEREASAAERTYREAERADNEAAIKLTEAIRRLDQAVKSTGAVPCAGALTDDVRAECSALTGHFRVRDEARQLIAKLEASAPGFDAAVKSARALRIDIDSKSSLAIKRAQEVRSTAESLRSEYNQLFHRLSGLRGKDRSPQLDRAEAEAGALQDRLKAAAGQADEAKTAADRAAAECPKYDDWKIQGAEDTARKAEVDLQGSMRSENETQRAVARLEAQVEAAKAAAAKTAELEAKLVPLERDLADWRFLARGLGREGVQALELDAAGPRVSALANELLADAYGPRFQIRFETQAAKADGKGVKETFDIIVTDTEKGREGNGQDFSGGEKVIIGEALGLAVGLFHAQAAGISLGTVVRDETVGALDPENGERYVAMLRSFLRAGRVHQLLFVAHQPALVDLADAVVRIENGRIEIRT